MKGTRKRKSRKSDPHEDYHKIIISELGIRPMRMIRAAFVLMGIIPLLILFYIIIGRNFFNNMLVGSNGFTAAIAVFISIAGFLYAYNLVSGMVRILLRYSAERKQSDDEKTELVIGVSHDLKTPLTVIKTGIHNLIDGIAGPMSKIQSEITRHCLRSVDKLIEFVNEILDISKIHFARMNFKREPVNLEEIVKNEVNEISELTRNNNQRLTCETHAGDTNIWADKMKLSRVIMNLLSNAVKYTSPGGRIGVALSADEDTVKFAVINTGSGIPADELEKIFNKYQRLDKHSGITGSGLGLSIVKDIVDLHKGHISVNAESGKEIKFSVVLPRDLRKAPRPA